MSSWAITVALSLAAVAYLIRALRRRDAARPARLGIALALLHLGVMFAHGAAHVGLALYATPLEGAFILLAIYLAPLAAIGLCARRRVTAGLGLLTASLGASFAFSVHHHFVVPSPDHVAHLHAGAWRAPFVATAAAGAILDGVGALVACWLWSAQLRASARDRLRAGRNVLIVDGTCVFCNQLAANVLRRDPSGLFWFAHVQSDFARAVLARHGANPSDVDPVYLLAAAGTPEERLLVDGAAGRTLWPALFGAAFVLRFVPLALLDVSYRLFARYRYRLFGQSPACIVPSPAERARFLS